MASRRINPKKYKPYGAAEELFRCLEPEVLIEGPAGTGKTLAVCQKAHMLCEMYPGVRVLFIRKTLKSLRESVLVTWEDEVLGQGHSAITGKATRSHRDSYTFSNRSHVVLAGIDTPSRHMSTQFDFIAEFEASELTEEDHEYLLTRNRNWNMPFQQTVCDTNPRQPTHWLNQRPDRPVRIPDDPRLPKPKAGQKQMVRLRSVHEDNPFLFDHKKGVWTTQGVDYLTKLEGLHGARYQWFRKGEWRAAEGMVLPMWNQDIHVVDWSEVPELPWYMAGIDFGYASPGCLQVWGFTGRQEQPIGEQRGYRVAEVYRKGWTLEEWAQVVMELRQDYPFRTGVADAADPGAIRFLNDYLGAARGRKHAGIFRPVDKSKGTVAGLELLRSVLSDEPPRQEPDGRWVSGGPRCFFVRDAFPYGLQKELLHEGKPACWEGEVESYTFPEQRDGKPTGEIPDKRCEGHAIDTTRYVWTHGWGKDMSPPEKPPVYPKGTCGYGFGDAESLWKERIREMRRRSR